MRHFGFETIALRQPAQIQVGTAAFDLFFFFLKSVSTFNSTGRCLE